MNSAADQFFAWMNGKVAELYTSVVTFFQEFFTHLPRISTGNWLSFLYNNSYSLAGALSYAMLYITLCIGFFYSHYLIRVGQLFILAATLSVIAPMFFIFCDWMMDVRDRVALLMMFDIDGQGAGVLMSSFASLVNILANLVATLTVAFFGIILVLVFIIFEIVAIFVKFTFLPALVLWPVFEKAKDWLEKLISMGSVTMLTGAPTVVFIIQVGKAIGPSVTGSNNTIVTPVVTTAAVITSLFVVLRMFKATQKVVSRGMSKVRGKTGVDGGVDVKSMPKPDTDAMTQQRLGGMPSTPTVSMSDQTPVNRDAEIKSAQRKATAISAVKGVASKGLQAGAAAIPGGVAVVAGAKVAASTTKQTINAVREYRSNDKPAPPQPPSGPPVTPISQPPTSSGSSGNVNMKV